MLLEKIKQCIQLDLKHIKMTKLFRNCKMQQLLPISIHFHRNEVTKVKKLILEVKITKIKELIIVRVQNKSQHIHIQ